MVCPVVESDTADWDLIIGISWTDFTPCQKKTCLMNEPIADWETSSATGWWIIIKKICFNGPDSISYLHTNPIINRLSSRRSCRAPCQTWCFPDTLRRQKRLVSQDKRQAIMVHEQETVQRGHVNTSVLTCSIKTCSNMLAFYQLVSLGSTCTPFLCFDLTSEVHVLILSLITLQGVWMHSFLKISI